MFITSDFDEPVLYNPAKVENGCNSLKIISGFTDAERIATHMIGLCDGIQEGKFVKGIQIEMILGMNSAISTKKHQDLCRTLRYMTYAKNMPTFKLNYVYTGKPVHSKVYIWSRGEQPTIAFCGSLNYSLNAFRNQRESVSSCDAQEALKYYDTLLPDTKSCFDEDVYTYLASLRKDKPEVTEEDLYPVDYTFYDGKKPIGTIEISLLQRNGSVGYGSGVNWGIRPNGTKRNRDQAYIPYNVADRISGFFPDRIHEEDKNCPIFRVITSDYGVFHMRMAQQGNKAIHVAESNAILGEWLRKRLDIPSGEFITKEMLDKYGKTSVRFRKYEDGTYLLDF